MKKLLITILKTIVFFIGWAIIIGFTPDISTSNQAILRLGWEFTPLVVIVVFTLVFVFAVEKGQIKIPIVKNFYKNAFVGLVTGFLWLGSVVTIFIITGTMRIQGENKVEYLFIWIVASLLNVVMQELLCRGYLYQLFKRNYNTIISGVLTTALFTAMHGGAFEAGIIPVLNIVTMSIFVTLLLEYTGTLLAPIIVHFIWNTVGAIILGGVSLASDYPNLLNSEFQGNILISGGVYKIEGSIIVLIINILLILVFFLLNKKIVKSN